MNTGLKWGIGGLAFIALMAGLSLMYWQWISVTAPIKGKAEAERQIESKESRIQRYEHFFDLCASAQPQQVALRSQQARLETAETSKERSRIRANIAGVEANLARTVNQYNADSGKNYTAARFKASNLPYQLSTEETIQCATY